MLTTDLIRANEPGSQALLVVLHGLGDSMEGYRWMPGELGLPWLNYLLVNAPDDYYGGYSWFDLYENSGPGIARSRQLLAEVIDCQIAAGTPASQIALFGFSQGCLMTLETGIRYPQRFAGLVGISGFIHEPEPLLKAFSPVAREQHFLVTHGTLDPLLSIAPVRGQIEQLRAAGLSVEWHEFVKAHTIAGEAELAVIRQFLVRAFQRPEAGSAGR